MAELGKIGIFPCLDPPTHVTLAVMRRMLAMVLLFCFGILIPAGFASSRFCLLQGGFVDAVSCDSEVSGEDDGQKCCVDCHRGEDESTPCCVDLEGLPDAQVPQFQHALPALASIDLPAPSLPASREPVTLPGKVPVQAPIRGPTSPAAFRAVLEVWGI